MRNILAGGDIFGTSLDGKSEGDHHGDGIARVVAESKWIVKSAAKASYDFGSRIMVAHARATSLSDPSEPGIVAHPWSWMN